MRTMIAGLMIGLALMVAGCMQSLSEIHSAAPREVGFYSAPYHELVVCAKERAQTEEWNPGPAVVESIESVGSAKTRLYASVYSSLVRTVLWEMTFTPEAAGSTVVEYRDQWTADHLHAQAWALIARCAQQTTSPAVTAR